MTPNSHAILPSRQCNPAKFRNPAEVFVVIDVETATRDADSICGIGVVRVEHGVVVAKQSLLIRPPRREFLFSHIHNIYWDTVANEKAFADVWPTLTPLLDGAAFLCAFNAPFDKRMVVGCCKAFGLTPPQQEWQCAMSLYRKRWHGQPYDLASACERLGIPLNHHEAGSDAEACARVMLALSGQAAN